MFCVKNQKFGGKKSVNAPKQQQNVRKADERDVSQSNEVPRKGQPSAPPRLAGRGGGVVVKRAGRVSPERVSAGAKRFRYSSPPNLGAGAKLPQGEAGGRERFKASRGVEPAHTRSGEAEEGDVMAQRSGFALNCDRGRAPPRALDDKRTCSDGGVLCKKLTESAVL